MEVKSIVVSGGGIILLMIAFASCIPKSPKKELKNPSAEEAQQLQPEPKLTTLKCVYSGTIEGESRTKQVDNEYMEFQFDREKSTITIMSDDGMQSVNASVSPDLILFKTVESRNVSSQYGLYSLTTSNYQIDRKTLQFNNWGDSEWAGRDEKYMTWKYQGSCEKVVPNLEGNKI